MVVSEVFNDDKKDLTSFSGRLNAVVDCTGRYPSLADGRVAEMAKDFRVGRTTMNWWLNTNKIPPKPMLAALVEGLLIHIKEPSVSAGTVMAWLEYGSLVPNPFLSDPNVAPFSAVPSQQEIAAVFTAILTQAKALQVSDLFDRLSEKDSENIACTALTVMMKSPPPRSPDPDLIAAMLKMAISK